MRKTLVIMVIICGCAWFGSSLNAIDYTFNLVNNHATLSMKKIRINSTKVSDFASEVLPGNDGKIVLQSPIGSKIELKVGGVWCTAISNFDDYVQNTLIKITLKPDGSFSVLGIGRR